MIEIAISADFFASKTAHHSPSFCAARKRELLLSVDHFPHSWNQRDTIYLAQQRTTKHHLFDKSSWHHTAPHQSKTFTVCFD
jgi:hypothetical protein